MSRRSSLPVLLLSVVCSTLLTVAVCLAQTQTTSRPEEPKAHAKKKVDPAINAQFKKANVKEFIKRFESNDREVYAKRREIVAALELKPGMAVADVGAGTGLFTRLIAQEVGPRGKVYAVDVSRDFLAHISKEARRANQSQIVTVQGSQDSTNLPSRSVDVAFLCDVYHHLENHEKVLASIREALKPGGALLLVEFDRIEGKSTPFVLKHIRASQSEFRAEIEAAGFPADTRFKAPALRENFVARFRRTEKVPGGRVKRRG